jgi:protein involved in polysaccharide export with SLBB domain
MSRLPGAVLVSLVCLLASGCVAWTNPVANGIPVCRVPPELLAGPVRNEMLTIPMHFLKQPPPKVYRFAPDDVLGVYIEGILPASDPKSGATNPPIQFSSQIDTLMGGSQPAMGFPIPVQEDGTILLPLISPISVQGMSTSEAAEAIRKAYLDAEIIRPGRERVIVTRMAPRRIRVSVVRQEVGGFSAGGSGLVVSGSSQKQGTGHTVNLPAYDNDVLTALMQSGGLPGSDAYSDIYVFRAAANSESVAEALKSLPAGQNPQLPPEITGAIIRIPTKISRDDPLPFKPEDIILQNGDVVFIEARNLDFFTTGGLLGSGQQVLPRDYDLDVLTAVAQLGGSIVGSGGVGGGGSGTAGVSTAGRGGIGSFSPSLLTVLRRTPGGGQIPIRVDLNRALRDPRERIRVQPGDTLILQETPAEAFVRYATGVINLSFASELFRTSTSAGAISASGP